MDKSQCSVVADRLMSLMSELAEQEGDCNCTSSQNKELRQVYLQSITVTGDRTELIELLGKAMNIRDSAQMMVTLWQAVSFLKTTDKQPLKYTPLPIEEAEQPDSDRGDDDYHEEVEEERRDSIDSDTGAKARQSPPSSSLKKKVKTTTEERYEWVKGVHTDEGIRLHPTPREVEQMRNTLTQIHDAWHSRDGVSTTQPLLDDQMKLISIFLEGNVYCLLRHVLLYMQVKYGVFVRWRHNLDRERRRDLALMSVPGAQKYTEGETLRSELGLVSMWTTQTLSYIGLLDGYERPNASKKNMAKKKVLLVKLEGSMVCVLLAIPVGCPSFMPCLGTTRTPRTPRAHCLKARVLLRLK